MISSYYSNCTSAAVLANRRFCLAIADAILPRHRRSAAVSAASPPVCLPAATNRIRSHSIHSEKEREKERKGKARVCMHLFIRSHLVDDFDAVCLRLVLRCLESPTFLVSLCAAMVGHAAAAVRLLLALQVLLRLAQLFFVSRQTTSCTHIYIRVSYW